MNVNKSKINLTNKICSTLFFVFTVINFTLSILSMVFIDGNPQNSTSKTILNIPLAISVIITIGLNIYLITGMIIEDKQNFKNAMFYLLLVILVFSIIAYIYSIVNINQKYSTESDPKITFTTEFWLLLVASGLSALFAGWNCLINWNLLKPLLLSRSEIQLTESTLDNENQEQVENKNEEQSKEETLVNL